MRFFVVDEKVESDYKGYGYKYGGCDENTTEKFIFLLFVLFLPALLDFCSLFWTSFINELSELALTLYFLFFHAV
jgi:hypothetical protein